MTGAALVGRRGIPEPQAGPQEMRDAADRILDGDEFVIGEPSLIERVQNWFGDRIADLLDSVSSGTGPLGVVVLIAVVGVVIWLVVRFGASVRVDPGPGEIGRVDPAMSADDWRAEAVRQEAAGELKLAVRSLYRALVADLVAQGVLDEVAGRTTGEHRLQVRARKPSGAEAFDRASGVFDHAWYADEELSTTDLAGFREQAGAAVSDRAVVASPAGGR